MQTWFYRGILINEMGAIFKVNVQILVNINKAISLSVPFRSVISG